MPFPDRKLFSGFDPEPIEGDNPDPEPIVEMPAHLPDQTETEQVKCFGTWVYLGDQKFEQAKAAVGNIPGCLTLRWALVLDLGQNDLEDQTWKKKIEPFTGVLTRVAQASRIFGRVLVTPLMEVNENKVAGEQRQKIFEVLSVKMTTGRKLEDFLQEFIQTASDASIRLKLGEIPPYPWNER